MEAKFGLIPETTDNCGTICDLLGFSYGPEGLGRVVLVTIAPEHSRGGHYHTDISETIYCLSGQGTIEFRYDKREGETLAFPQKISCIEIPPGTWYRITNTGNKILLLLCVKSRSE